MYVCISIHYITRVGLIVLFASCAAFCLCCSYVARPLVFLLLFVPIASSVCLSLPLSSSFCSAFSAFLCLFLLVVLRLLVKLFRLTVFRLSISCLLVRSCYLLLRLDVVVAVRIPADLWLLSHSLCLLLLASLLWFLLLVLPPRSDWSCVSVWTPASH